MACEWLGVGGITHLNDSWLSQMYYNSNVFVGSRECKYGVISTHHLVDDLLNWRTMYAAGRMHKPTLALVEHEDVLNAQRVNMQSALTASLLMLTTES